MEYRYESATCKLTDHGDGTADLTHVYAQKRGQGHASAVIRLALEEADARGLTVYLLVFGAGAYYLVRDVRRGFPDVVDSHEPKLGERPARPLSAATDLGASP